MKLKIAVAAAVAVALACGLLWISMIKPKAPDIRITKTGGYRLLVDGKPYTIKGVCYNPIPIGKDYEYNFWADEGKPWMIDGQLMQQAGVNTVRLYRTGKDPVLTRRVINDLYRRFGIRSLVGTYLGYWSWPPPNYSDPIFRKKMKARVIEMVKLYKDSPGVLMWVLGNENNYSFDRNNIQRWTSPEIEALPSAEARRKEKARIYYSYVNELAREVKKIDPVHPVVLNVGETASLDLAKPLCPDVDVIGMIAYRGPSFGNLFRQIKQKFDLPVVVTEWGADSYNALKGASDEDAQADCLLRLWQEMAKNFHGKGEGNCLGGAVFEWTDEWWKGDENLPRTWSVHDTASHWSNPAYHSDAAVAGGLNMNEEWWGIVALDPDKTKGGQNARLPKKAYYTLQSLWTESA